MATKHGINIDLNASLNAVSYNNKSLKVRNLQGRHLQKGTLPCCHHPQ
jgi:hypothetical protein